MATLTIDTNNFEADVMKSDTPVVVDFWAEWCGPCKQIGPALEELSDEMNGKVKIVKVDVDNNPTTPAQLGVRGIPALFIIKDGQEVATRAGAAPKSTLQSWIETEVCPSGEGPICDAPQALKPQRGRHAEAMVEPVPVRQDLSAQYERHPRIIRGDKPVPLEKRIQHIRRHNMPFGQRVEVADHLHVAQQNAGDVISDRRVAVRQKIQRRNTVRRHKDVVRVPLIRRAPLFICWARCSM